MNLEQIARDIREGSFPAKSEKTIREQAIMKLAMESLEAGAPGLSPLIRQGIARSIAMKVVASDIISPEIPK